MEIPKISNIKICVDKATRNIALKDFNNFAKITSEYGSGYVDLLHTLKFLTDSGCIIENNGLLEVNYRMLEDLLINPELVVDDIDLRDWKIIREAVWKYAGQDNSKTILGLQGELYVIEELKKIIDEDRHLLIDHVSQRNDLLGYDIASPSTKTDKEKMYLEVKTSRYVTDSFTFFLSRNEYEVGKKLHDWYIVLVNLEHDDFTIFGHVDSKSLIEYIPVESNIDSSWTGLRINFPVEDLQLGLP
jgi:hypothetical protein